MSLHEYDYHRRIAEESLREEQEIVQRWRARTDEEILKEFYRIRALEEKAKVLNRLRKALADLTTIP